MEKVNRSGMEKDQTIRMRHYLGISKMPELHSFPRFNKIKKKARETL